MLDSYSMFKNLLKFQYGTDYTSEQDSCAFYSQFKSAHLKNKRLVNNFEFERYTGSAIREDALVEGSSPISIFRPTKTNQKHEDNFRIASALATVPDETLKLIKRVVVQPESGTAKIPLFDKSGKLIPGKFKIKKFTPEEKWGGIDIHGGINIFPQNNYILQNDLNKMFIHEAGHLLDQKNFYNRDLKVLQWLKAEKKDIISVSQYAKKNYAEDFAETYLSCQAAKRLGMLDELRAMMPEKIKMVEELAKREVDVQKKKRSP